MSNQIIETYSNGKKLTNLLANKIITEINKETKNHKTNIQVINNGNFVVVKGITTHSTPLNFSKLFNSYYQKLFNKTITFNVVDLIEYSQDIKEDPIYINKTYVKDDFINNLNKITYNDTLTGLDYRLTACTDLNTILINKKYKSKNLNNIISNFEDYKIVNLNNLSESFYSSEKYGKHLKSSKLFDSYFNYIVYNIFERNLCKDINIEFFTDSDFESINWENLSLKITSKSLITSTEWLESLILDLFTFEPNKIISRWDLENYDFEEEIISNENIWKIKDKVGEMILV